MFGQFNDFFFFFKVLRLLLKVNKIATEQHKWPKIGQTHDNPFFPGKALAEALRSS